MFLDEKLYNHAIAAIPNINSQAAVNELMQELIVVCEDHWKPFVKPNITQSRMVVHWDRAFKSWDLFVNRLRKDQVSTHTLMADLFAEHSYKKAFFEDEGFSKLYNECKM